MAVALTAIYRRILDREQMVLAGPDGMLWQRQMILGAKKITVARKPRVKRGQAMKFESKADRRDAAVAFFCRHLVGLCVSYKHKTPEDAKLPPRFAACSGTLIMIKGACCFLTAGHVLKELETLRASDKIELVEAKLVDTFGPKPISEVPIPFDLKNAPLFYIDDDQEGLDFGVIALHPGYVRLLFKNGIEALTEERWIHQGRVKFDGYAMLGFPEEFASDRLSCAGDAIVSPILLPVTKLDAGPESRAPRRHPEFVAQIDSKTPKRIEGMSGGPILGFRQEPDGSHRYWLVALQSSWNPDTRTIYACPIPIIASLMTEWSDEAPAA